MWNSQIMIFAAKVTDITGKECEDGKDDKWVNCCKGFKEASGYMGDGGFNKDCDTGKINVTMDLNDEEDPRGHKCGSSVIII